MATGKTNARYITVDVDAADGSTVNDVSASVATISSVGLTYDVSDVTAYSDGVHNVTLGHPTASLSMSGPFSNTATIGAHTVFSAIAGSMANTITVTIQFGIRATPTTGDPEFEGEYYCTSYVVNGADATYTANFDPATATAPAWGTVS